jgi:D-alanyl-D-alanine endopeptidase (penicillin-binding protein 7)
MTLAWMGATTAAAALAAAICLPFAAQAQSHAKAPPAVANFHPCNSQPALPICQYGEGRRVAAVRWGAQAEENDLPLDPDALPNAPMASANSAKDLAGLRATTLYVLDMNTSNVLFAKNENVVRPIASISKLMTAIVVLDAGLPMDQTIQISASDDGPLPSDMTPRLPAGAKLTRGEVLHLALMASENRAAYALGRTFPGGMKAFVAAMNAKAQELGMKDTKFVEPTGLSHDNVSSPRDLALLLRAASEHPLIQQYSTDDQHSVSINASMQAFRNTNPLVGRPGWDIQISKTGFIRDAGECLVMMARIGERELAVVVLNAQGARRARIGDAVRLRRILQNQVALR